MLRRSSPLSAPICLVLVQFIITQSILSPVVRPPPVRPLTACRYPFAISLFPFPPHSCSASLAATKPTKRRRFFALQHFGCSAQPPYIRLGPFRCLLASFHPRYRCAAPPSPESPPASATDLCLGPHPRRPSIPEVPLNLGSPPLPHPSPPQVILGIDPTTPSPPP